LATSPAEEKGPTAPTLLQTKEKGAPTAELFFLIFFLFRRRQNKKDRNKKKDKKKQYGESNYC
jgi:hypothetical protein